MIRICHITTVHKRYDTRIFQKQCLSLANAGFEITLLCADGIENEVSKGIKIESIKFNSKNHIFRIFIASKKIYSLALSKNADIYQIHDPELISVGLKLKKKGKKVIFDSHEDLPRQILEKDWIPKIFRHLISRLTEIYINRSIKYFNAVLTVTPHIVDVLRKSSSNVVMITNYPIVDVNKENITFEDYISKKNILCYSGTVYRNSLQKNILEAIENVKDIKYTIVGSIEDSLLSELRQCKSWQKVNLINRVPKEELIEIYNKATIGIVMFEYSPNMGHNRGTLGNNKIFEYMYNEMPIICTDFLLWKEIVKKYNCGICVSPNDIDSLRKAIEYLIENKEEAYKMGQNGKKAVLDQFNWNTQEKIYIDAINKIVNNGI
jgi:glycosyltransferase involved in cell wall biosynthesis